MDPRVARALLAEAVEEALIRFGVGCSPDELPEVFDRISVCYQGLGIALVLMTGERTRFRECLVRSAWARLHLLQVATTLQPPPRQRATSYGEGFLDAVAAGHWLVAGEIAALSPSDWVPEGEYEDDFCYFRLLFGFADEVPPPRPPSRRCWRASPAHSKASRRRAWRCARAWRPVMQRVSPKLSRTSCGRVVKPTTRLVAGSASRMPTLRCSGCAASSASRPSPCCGSQGRRASRSRALTRYVRPA